jgi:hypothetical protein
VGEIYDGGVVLKLDAAASAGLPAPAANPGSLKVNPGDLSGAREGFLRRAWNSLSGKR